MITRQFCTIFQNFPRYIRSVANIEPFFKSNSYAIIGANPKSNSFGFAVSSNFINYFPGKTFLINPKGGNILNQPILTSIHDISPDQAEVAVIISHSSTVLTNIKECLERGIRYFIIISSGFTEVSSEGAQIQTLITELCQKYGAHLIGPNCMGVFDNNSHVNTLFLPPEKMGIPLNGPLSLIFQSGALAISLINEINNSGYSNIGISRLVSYGNAADINENDILENFSNDEKTSLILMYLEGIKNSQHFFSLLRSTTFRKPVLIWKAGVTEKGKTASLSHSASIISGNSKALQYILETNGSINIESFPDFIDISSALQQPLPFGPRLAIVSNSGGSIITSVDKAVTNGLNIPSLSSKTIEELKSSFPNYYICANPMDITASASLEQYLKAISLVLLDSNIDSLMVIIVTPSPSLGRQNGYQKNLDHFLKEVQIVQKSLSIQKPIYFTIFGGTDEINQYFSKRIKNANYPVYNCSDNTVRMIFKILRYVNYLNHEKKRVHYSFQPPDYSMISPDIKTIIENGKKQNLNMLLEHESRKIFRLLNLQIPPDCFASTIEECVDFFQKLQKNDEIVPVVMKAVSPQIIHKTEQGAVVVNLRTIDSVKETAIRFFQSFKDQDLKGILIYPMVPVGTEMMIGIHHDPALGQMVLTGPGGQNVELLNDITFALTPVNPFDSQEMLKNLKFQKILQGFRGSPTVNIEKFSQLISQVSYFASMFKNDIESIDLNPVIVTHQGDMWAIDTRIILKY